MDQEKAQLRKKNLVTIKGSNEGLSFRLDDEEPFSIVAEELKHKVRRELSTLLTGPLVRIKIDCGRRELSDKQRKLLEEIISLKENLILTRINSSVDLSETIDSQDSAVEAVVHMIDEQTAKVHRGTVRSGQVLDHDGNLVIWGDINGGAHVVATGDIMVLGRVHGFVHAGSKGDRNRVVVACSWGKCQIRIADCVGKASASELSGQPMCLSTAFLDEYRIQFKHKNHLVL